MSAHGRRSRFRPRAPGEAASRFWVKGVVTPADIARLGQLLTETGWRAEVGINLAHYNPRLAADEPHTLPPRPGNAVALRDGTVDLSVDCGSAEIITPPEQRMTKLAPLA